MEVNKFSSLFGGGTRSIVPSQEPPPQIQQELPPDNEGSTSAPLPDPTTYNAQPSSSSNNPEPAQQQDNLPSEISLISSELEESEEEEISAADAFFANRLAEQARAGPCGAPRRSIRDLGVIINTKLRSRFQYESQPQRGRASAWVDLDDSGTYDPLLDGKRVRDKDKENKKGRVAGSRLGDASQGEGQGGSSGSGGKERSSRCGIPVGYGFPMTFRFSTDEGRAYLWSIKPGWKDDSTASGDLGEDGYSMRRHARLQKRYVPQRHDGLTIDQLTLGHPQRRGCKACFEVGDDECSLLTDPLLYPCDGCEDAECDCELIIPPPLKKVCERCKSKRISCSYRESHGQGVDACEQCAQDGEQCIAGPLKSTSITSHRIEDILAAKEQGKKISGTNAAKRRYVSCHACRSSGIKCSLKRGEDGPCTHCAGIGTTCTFEATNSKRAAKVTKNSTDSVDNNDSSDNNDNSHDFGNSSKGSKSSQASEKPNTKRVRQESYKQQLKRQDRERRLRHKRRATTSTGERRPRKKRNNTISHQASRLLHEGGNSNSSFDADTGSNNATIDGIEVPTRTIKTSFAYPITFNFQPTLEALNGPKIISKDNCHWCTGPFFGLCGYGETEVVITTAPTTTASSSLPSPQTQKFTPSSSRPPPQEETTILPTGTEITGGHTSNGKDPSNMCITCTFTRIRIMSCIHHQIIPIPGTSPSNFNHHALYNSLAKFADDPECPEGALAGNTKWCSICPSPAFFKCGTPQEFDDFGENEESDGGDSGAEECVGCGLLLCEACADLVVKLQRGYVGTLPVLDRLLAVAESGSSIGEYDTHGIRADAGLFKSDGEMMRALKLDADGEEEKSELKMEESEDDGFVKEENSSDDDSSDSGEKNWGIEDFKKAKRDERYRKVKKHGRSMYSDRRYHIGGAKQRSSAGLPSDGVPEYSQQVIVIDDDDD